MEKLQCNPSKIISQLHRINGQVQAIEKMYKDKREVEEIVRVVLAARASMDSVSKMLITDKVNGCFDHKQISSREDLLKLVNTLFNIT